MKKIILIFLVTFAASYAHADPMKVLFFYPGGQGDQQAAQPILDSFSEALKRTSGGKIDAKVFYISDPKQGLQFIRAEKPQAAILGLDTYLQYGDELGAKVIAKTLQLPSADGTDQYFIVGKSGTALPSSGAIVLSSQRPLESGFVAGKLFPGLRGTQWQIDATPNIVGKLRAIGSGSQTGLVLLDQFEYANVSRLKTPWAQAVTAIAKSDKVSSAPVVVFSANLTPEQSADLKAALVKVGQDKSSEETLGNLRIKGFQPASGI